MHCHCSSLTLTNLARPMIRHFVSAVLKRNSVKLRLQSPLNSKVNESALSMEQNKTRHFIFCQKPLSGGFQKKKKKRKGKIVLS